MVISSKPIFAPRNVTISTPLGPTKFIVDRLKATERLSTLFKIDVEVRSKDKDIDFKTLIGKLGVVTFHYHTSKERHFSGIIGEIRQGITSDTTGYTHYLITLRPQLWMATFNRDYRIFQNMSANDIIKKMLGENDIADLKYKASTCGSIARKYCVQYGESAFDYVARLMAEEGIGYTFTHALGGDELDVFDDVSPLLPIDPAVLHFHPKEVDIAWGDTVQEFYLEERVVAKKASYADYNFVNPSTKLHPLTQGDGTGGEVYTYPGRFFKMSTGNALNTLQIEQLEWNKKMFYGRSTVPSMIPGKKFMLNNHPRLDVNTEYVIYEVEHFLDVSAGLHMSDGLNSPQNNITYPYYNRFSCFPAATQFRPEPIPKPRIYSNQMAIVVGPEGEEIHTDEYGRIKVQFYWDQRGKNDDTSSCWIRVSQSWSGSQWGFVFLPRIGMEVIVSFFEGDPDRPVVVGCVYNGNNRPPYNLPSEKTKSTIKTNSSKNAKGRFNEIRFEDMNNKEQVYVRAQKDYDREVFDGERTLIIHEKSDTKTIKKGHYLLTHEAAGDMYPTHRLHMIKGDQFIDLNQGHRTITLDKGNEENHLKQGNKTFLLDKGNFDTTLSSGNMTITLASGNMETTVVGGIKTTATKDIDSTSQKNIKATASSNIELTASSSIKATASSNIELTASSSLKGTAPGGIELSSAGSITIKAGGSLTIEAGGVLTLSGSAVVIG